MGSSSHSKTLGRACCNGNGEHLAIWGLSLGPPAPEQMDTVLAELLAERESRGSRVPVVSLLMRARDDADWIQHAIGWLSVRGRRVIVRTRVQLPKEIVAALVRARETGPGVVVELELAHHKPVIQRALLGDHVDTAAALLLQAQHLATLEIPVVARLAPLMPGIHDQPNGFMPLVRNVEAADVRRVVLSAGNLHPQQLQNLAGCQRELSVAGLLELARAYAVDPMVVLGGAVQKLAPDADVHKLKPRRAQAFVHALERIVEDAGLEVPGCGCHSHCELGSARSTNSYEVGYESVMGRDLFAGLEGHSI
jgi:hypothetical protein